MSTLSSSTTTDIERRAREIWLARGSPVGQDLEIWLEAERQLRPITHPNVVRRHPSGLRRADDVDEDKLAERLDEFGEPDRRSPTSLDPS
jgi:DUF2934 family protein